MTTRIFTGAAVKEMDRIAIEQFGFDGYSLMTCAGERAFRRLQSALPGSHRVIVLCGIGNNGGDGYVLASAALDAGWTVQVYATGVPKTESATRARNRYQSIGGVIIDASVCEANMDSTNGDAIPDFLASVIVDALFGVGLTGAPRGSAAELIERANRGNAIRVALDVPSGLNADTGEVFSPCFCAHQTITFIAHKIGLLTGPARNNVGKLALEQLDVTEPVIRAVEHCAVKIACPKLLSRVADGHKGTYGTTVILGGDTGMLGAVLLAGGAALRAGAGKVRIASIPSHLDQPALWMPELMSEVLSHDSLAALADANAIAFGPGLGQSAWARSVYKRVVKLSVPMVLDADALNLLAHAPCKAPNSNWVLTPHPGEAARLLACSTIDVQNNRLACVLALAQRYNAVVVLKGAGTLIANPAGDVTVCDIGNPGMATAGMGDVLTGIIAALLAQGFSLQAAANYGVWLHARAADLQVHDTGQSSLIASDVINGIAHAFADAKSEVKLTLNPHSA